MQLVRKFPAFHGTRRFVTSLTSVRHLSLSWVSPIQSIYPHPTSWRSILILVLSTHLLLDLTNGLLPSSFPSKTLYTPLSSPIRATCPAASTTGKDLVPIVQEAGWAPRLLWTDGKSRPYRDSIPDRPAHSQLLYRLSYLAHGFPK